MHQKITNALEKMRNDLKKYEWLQYVPGFRSNSINHILIACVYYGMMFYISAITRLFPFLTILLWSIPFIVFSIIDICRYKKYKNAIVIPICLVAIVMSAIFTIGSLTPQKIHITEKEIIFDDINQSKEITYTIVPENAIKSNIELISDNKNVADFENNSLFAKSEGETTIYATLKNSDITSEKIHVVVHDKAAEAMRKQQEQEAREKAEREAREKAEREAQARKEAEERAQQEAENSTQRNITSNSDDEESDIVYIGKTGKKYHYKDCHTLKGQGRAISLKEAKKQGRQSCQHCNR